MATTVYKTTNCHAESPNVNDYTHVSLVLLFRFQYVHYEVDYTACPDIGKVKNVAQVSGPGNLKQVSSTIIF